MNHVGHFLLTDLLLDRLRAERAAARRRRGIGRARVRERGLDFDDLQSEGGYRWGKVYGKSKLANIYFARELARRLEGSGVTSNSLHPGFVRSEFGQGGDLGSLYGFGLKYLAAPFAISQEQGAGHRSTWHPHPSSTAPRAATTSSASRPRRAESPSTTTPPAASGTPPSASSKVRRSHQLDRVNHLCHRAAMKLPAAGGVHDEEEVEAVIEVLRRAISPSAQPWPRWRPGWPNCSPSGTA